MTEPKQTISEFVSENNLNETEALNLVIVEFGLSPAEASLYLAIERGETKSDIVEI